ncbi:hypothetical protein PEC18_30115 [Paucibacter sp. O1-1]|nr:hypothetical protein [Paucibacter sp. O1-1]MDA3829976.1 hypothetical protein [Paucibacter sp. O1-1]
MREPKFRPAATALTSNESQELQRLVSKSRQVRRRIGCRFA